MESNGLNDPARPASLPVISGAPDISAAPAGANCWQPVLSAAQFELLLAAMCAGVPLPPIFEGKCEQSELVATTLASPNASPISSPATIETPSKRVLETSDTGSDSSMPEAGRPAKKARHQCPKCLKFFTRPSSLTTHDLTHTGEKPHACTFSGCGKRFSTESNMRRHSKLHTDPQPRRLRRIRPHQHHMPADFASMIMPADTQSTPRRLSEPMFPTYWPDLAALGFMPTPAASD
ncbi:hypothetical protein IWW50_005533, partial [Coemansia erecta]